MICKKCKSEFDEIYEACPYCGTPADESIMILIPFDEEPKQEFEEVLTDDSDKLLIIADDYPAVKIQQEEELFEEEKAVFEQEEAPAEDEAYEMYESEASEAVEEPVQDEAAEENEAEQAEEESDIPEVAYDEPAEDEEQSVAYDEEELVSDVEADFVKEADPVADEQMQEEQNEAAEDGSEVVPQAPSTVRAPRKRVRTADEPVTKKSKRASVAIIVLVCLVGILAAVFAVLKTTTDIFEKEDPTEQTVVNVSFTDQDEKELELIIAKCFSAAKKEYDCSVTDAETFLARINPSDKGNVYSRINGVAEILQTEADPANRFADENGEYAYYKLEEARVDKVLGLFGLEALRGENTKDYYYCDGYYYFAENKVKATPEVAAKIVKSRRVLDGTYYIEAYFYLENGSETAKTDSCYFVVEMNKDEAGTASFVIREINAKPIFGSEGRLIDAGSEKVKEVIEGKADNGQLYCRYTIVHPILEGEGVGYTNVNDFFKNAVTVYNHKAEAAQQDYEAYKENGGNDAALPYIENIVAEVVFEDDNNISFIGKFSRLDPVAKNSEEVATDGITEESDELEQTVTPVFYKKSVEAYTIDKASGDFVLKDSVVGKNYMLVSQILYRIYSGYEYKDLLPAQEADEDYAEEYVDVPEDTDGIGTKIYESSWSLTKEGIAFYYVTEYGYIQQVVIPYAVADMIVA